MIKKKWELDVINAKLSKKVFDRMNKQAGAEQGRAQPGWN